jgi:hypothetical protein
MGMTYEEVDGYVIKGHAVWYIKGGTATTLNTSLQVIHDIKRYVREDHDHEPIGWFPEEFFYVV